MDVTVTDNTAAVGRVKSFLESNRTDNRTIFFAKVLRSAGEDEVKALFGRYGKVEEVNLFRAFQRAPTTKGCGLVTMSSHEDASAAIEALDKRFICKGMDSPLVVKWMDAALQQRRREQHLAARRSGLVHKSPLASSVITGGNMGGMGGMLPSLAPPALQSPYLQSSDAKSSESPPPGCDPDAFKLFVGNIPQSCTAEILRPVFETIGKVVELVIVYDLVSQQSKGSAFLWYAARQDAERAVLHFNQRHVLPDPDGAQDRPLVVRRAKARSRHPTVALVAFLEGAMVDVPVALQSSVMQGQPLPLSNLYYPGKVQPGLMTQSLQPVQISVNGDPSLGGNVGLGSVPQVSGVPQPYFYDPNTGGTGLAVSQSGQLYAPQPYGSMGGNPNAGMYTAHPNTFTVMQQPALYGNQINGIPPNQQMSMYGRQLNSIGTDPNGGLYGWQQAVMGPGQSGGMYGGQPTDLGDMQAVGMAGGQQQVGDSGPHVMMQVGLTGQQLVLVNMHLFNVRAISGAELAISPGAPGIFSLTISGNQSQVDSAKGLMGSLLGQHPS